MNIKLSSAVAIAALTLSGCGTPGSHQEAASTAGAVLGAGVGLAAGAAVHRPVEGAVAGALIGGGSGSIAGQAVDRRVAAKTAARRAREEEARWAANPPVGKDDVITMTKAKVSETVILNRVATASHGQPITTQDIVDMKNAGVSDKVVNALLTKLKEQTAAAAAVQTPGEAEITTHYDYYEEPWPGPYVYWDPWPDEPYVIPHHHPEFFPHPPRGFHSPEPFHHGGGPGFHPHR